MLGPSELRQAVSYMFMQTPCHPKIHFFAVSSFPSPFTCIFLSRRSGTHTQYKAPLKHTVCKPLTRWTFSVKPFIQFLLSLASLQVITRDWNKVSSERLDLDATKTTPFVPDNKDGSIRLSSLVARWFSQTCLETRSLYSINASQMSNNSQGVAIAFPRFPSVKNESFQSTIRQLQ